MDMSGEYRIAAPRRKVWEALNDPAILEQCVPGCEGIEKLSDTEMTGQFTARFGPLKAQFSGKLYLCDLDPPNSCRITGEGSGARAGFVKGGATVRLGDDDGGTLLSVTVDAQVGGKLARYSSRFINTIIHKLADDFFRRFNDVLSAAPPAPASVASRPPLTSRRAPLPIWIIVLAAAATALLVYCYVAK